MTGQSPWATLTEMEVESQGHRMDRMEWEREIRGKRLGGGQAGAG